MFLGANLQLFSQTDSTQNNINLSTGASIMSRYVWRGTQFGGNSPSIQPSLNVTYKNLTLGAWGAYSTGGVHASQEMDLSLSYSFLNNFSAVITDYYFPTDTGNYNYLGYDDKTGHIFELGLSYSGNKIPITISAYVNFAGNDAPTYYDDVKDTANFNKKSGIQYSNYFEIAYNNTLKNNISYNIFLGFTLNNPKAKNDKTGFIGEQGFYGNGPGVVNMGVTVNKSIKITNKYSLPITTSFIINPQAEKVFLIFGLSF